MRRQIEGQLNLIDLMQDKTGYSIGDQYRSEGYINAYDAMPDHPCEVDVIDHAGNRFRIECQRGLDGSMVFYVGNRGKGYDICWWREVKQKTCRTCSHWRPYVSGLGEIYHGWTCFGFGISKSDRADKPACDTYEERTDG